MHRSIARRWRIIMSTMTKAANHSVTVKRKHMTTSIMTTTMDTITTTVPMTNHCC